MTTKRGEGVIFVDNNPKGFELSYCVGFVFFIFIQIDFSHAQFVVSVEIVRNGDLALFLEDGTKLKMTVMRQSVNSHNFNLP